MIRTISIATLALILSSCAAYVEADPLDGPAPVLDPHRDWIRTSGTCKPSYADPDADPYAARPLYERCPRWDVATTDGSPAEYWACDGMYAVHYGATASTPERLYQDYAGACWGWYER